MVTDDGVCMAEHAHTLAEQWSTGEATPSDICMQGVVGVWAAYHWPQYAGATLCGPVRDPLQRLSLNLGCPVINPAVETDAAPLLVIPPGIEGDASPIDVQDLVRAARAWARWRKLEAKLLIVCVWLTAEPDSPRIALEIPMAD